MQVGAADGRVRVSARRRPGSRPVQLPLRRRVVLLTVVNIVVLTTVALLGEIGFRLFWKPKYRIGCERWWVGSGMTTAGRKYWPASTYRISSPEFSVLFRTNARGYRARPGPPR